MIFSIDNGDKWDRENDGTLVEKYPTGIRPEDHVEIVRSKWEVQTTDGAGYGLLEAIGFVEVDVDFATKAPGSSYPIPFSKKLKTYLDASKKIEKMEEREEEYERLLANLLALCNEAERREEKINWKSHE